MKKILEEAKDAKSELEMTSMIDVVFLLLIFFMCATKFKIPEGSLDSFLPRDRGGPATQSTVTRGCRISLMASESGEVVVLADDLVVSMETSGESVSDFELNKEIRAPNVQEILDHIENRKENYTGLGANGLPVIIDFQNEVPTKYVVQMLNLCYKAEIMDVSFAQPEIPIE